MVGTLKEKLGRNPTIEEIYNANNRFQIYITATEVKDANGNFILVYDNNGNVTGTLKKLEIKEGITLDGDMKVPLSALSSNFEPTQNELSFAKYYFYDGPLYLAAAINDIVSQAKDADPTIGSTPILFDLTKFSASAPALLKDPEALLVLSNKISAGTFSFTDPSTNQTITCSKSGSVSTCANPGYNNLSASYEQTTKGFITTIGEGKTTTITQDTNGDGKDDEVKSVLTFTDSTRTTLSHVTTETNDFLGKQKTTCTVDYTQPDKNGCVSTTITLSALDGGATLAQVDGMQNLAGEIVSASVSGRGAQIGKVGNEAVITLADGASATIEADNKIVHLQGNNANVSVEGNGNTVIGGAGSNVSLYGDNNRYLPTGAGNATLYDANAKRIATIKTTANVNGGTTSTAEYANGQTQIIVRDKTGNLETTKTITPNANGPSNLTLTDGQGTVIGLGNFQRYEDGSTTETLTYADGRIIRTNTDGVGNITSTANIQWFDDARIETVSYADGRQVKLSYDANNVLVGRENILSVRQTIGLASASLIDALSLVKAIQSGQPLPVIASGLKRAGEVSLREFLQACQKRGIEPKRRDRGKFVLRLESEIHEAAVLAAAAHGRSLNQCSVETLREAA